MPGPQGRRAAGPRPSGAEPASVGSSRTVGLRETTRSVAAAAPLNACLHWLCKAGHCYAKLSAAASGFAPPGGGCEISGPGVGQTSRDSSRAVPPDSAPPSGRGHQAPASDPRRRSLRPKGAGPERRGGAWERGGAALSKVTRPVAA